MEAKRDGSVGLPNVCQTIALKKYIDFWKGAERDKKYTRRCHRPAEPEGRVSGSVGRAGVSGPGSGAPVEPRLLRKT